MTNIPTVTIGQMREVDRLMVEEIGISIIMMMENASRNIAVLAREMLGTTARGKKIVVLCGKGNNGGDGLGAARHLINFAASCTVLLATKAHELGSDAKIQYNVLKHIGVEVAEYGIFAPNHLITHLGFADLIIDALIGYNLKGNPKEPIAEYIRLANQSKRPILAVDIPSGLNADTGQANSPTIRAAATLTLALPKVGLRMENAKEYVGELFVADLSIPKTVYDKLGIAVPVLFERKEVIKIV